MIQIKPFEDTAPVIQIDSHTYKAMLEKQWCMAGIGHGGLLLGIMMRAVKKHFSTTHAKLNQPHVMGIQASFLAPTPAGDVIFKIEDVKIGRGSSTVQVKLMNNKGKAAIMAMVQQTNFDTMKGWTVESPFLDYLPKLPAKGDRDAMFADQDPGWVLDNNIVKDFGFTPMMYYDMFVPRKGMPHKAAGDRWFTPRSEVRLPPWSQELVPFLCDVPYNPMVQDSKFGWLVSLAFTVDFKKALPDAGLEWLLVRNTTAAFVNSKLDYNATVLDENNEIVALTTQIMQFIGKPKADFFDSSMSWDRPKKSKI